MIREDNVKRIRTKLVVCGANIPTTAAADRFLHEQGVLCVPDFIANAGGVICAAMEYAGATQTAAFEAIAERIRANTEQVLEDSKRRGVLPRRAAEDLAAGNVVALEVSDLPPIYRDGALVRLARNEPLGPIELDFVACLREQLELRGILAQELIG